MMILVLLIILHLTRQRRHISDEDWITMLICCVTELVAEIAFYPQLKVLFI